MDVCYLIRVVFSNGRPLKTEQSKDKPNCVGCSYESKNQTNSEVNSLAKNNEPTSEDVDQLYMRV